MKAILGALVALVLVAGGADARLPRTPQAEIDALARTAAHGDTMLFGILQRVWTMVADVEASWIFKSDALVILDRYQVGQTKVEDVRATFNQPSNCHISAESETTGGIVVLSIGDSGGILDGLAMPVAMLGFQDGVLVSKTVMR